MKKKIEKNSNSLEWWFFNSPEVLSILKKMNTNVQKIIKAQQKSLKILDRMISKTNCLQDDVTEIKYKLSEKVDREEFEKLEKRMIKLEKLVFAKLS